MMDGIALLRTIGGLGTVLGLLAGAVWLVRRFDLALPGTNASPKRRLALVERLAIDPRRSLLLVRRDGREHLVLVGPDASFLIETVPVETATAAAASVGAFRPFAAMLADDCRAGTGA